jgi:hypothetical protein
VNDSSATVDEPPDEPRREFESSPGRALLRVSAHGDAVSILVRGELDPPTAEALATAVRRALAAGISPEVEVDASERPSGDVIRVLAECARRGAVLRFGGHGPTSGQGDSSGLQPSPPVPGDS